MFERKISKEALQSRVKILIANKTCGLKRLFAYHFWKYLKILQTTKFLVTVCLKPMYSPTTLMLPKYYTSTGKMERLWNIAWRLCCICKYTNDLLINTYSMSNLTSGWTLFHDNFGTSVLFNFHNLRFLLFFPWCQQVLFAV